MSLTGCAKSSNGAKAKTLPSQATDRIHPSDLPVRKYSDNASKLEYTEDDEFMEFLQWYLTETGNVSGTVAGAVPISPRQEKTLYIGNSLMTGLELYGTHVEGDTFITEVSITLKDFISKYSDEIQASDYTRVVAEFGSNEANYISVTTFAEQWEQLLAVVGDVDVYALRIPEGRGIKNVDALNSAISNVKGVTPLYDTLSFNYAGDGVHLTAKSYSDWYDWVQGAMT